MALFDRTDARGDQLVVSSDVASRALSVTAVEQDSVGRVYEKLASVYDVVFGPALHAGRIKAIRRMNIQPGSRILEVGIGTGINASLYPRHCHVTGIDLSASMLEKARERVARAGLPNIRLLEMDAADLRFPDASFDIVFACYLLTVVPDPVRVAAEMRRVCRAGGRIVLLNHFRSTNPVLSRLERAVSPVTARVVGFTSDVDLPAFLAQTGFNPVTVEKVNVPRIFSVVTYTKGWGDSVEGSE
jgi:phosphatidylethanolamine/phosphatidyl-N-methylethanolamine N-methyltransferase